MHDSLNVNGVTRTLSRNHWIHFNCHIGNLLYSKNWHGNDYSPRTGYDDDKTLNFLAETIQIRLDSQFEFDSPINPQSLNQAQPHQLWYKQRLGEITRRKRYFPRFHLRLTNLCFVSFERTHWYNTADYFCCWTKVNPAFSVHYKLTTRRLKLFVDLAFGSWLIHHPAAPGSAPVLLIKRAVERLSDFPTVYLQESSEWQPF